MKTLVIFLMMCSVAWSQPTEIEKPDIPSDKLLTEQEQVEVKEYLQGKIFKELQPIKNDYVSYVDRGTVEFNPKKGRNKYGREVFAASNLSFHKLTIPDGTTLEGINFTQKEPHTKAIKGENLIFKDCNLKNIEPDPTWTFIDCSTLQYKRIIKGEEILPDGNIKLILSHQVEKDGYFKEVCEVEEITNSIDYDRDILRYNIE